MMRDGGVVEAVNTAKRVPSRTIRCVSEVSYECNTNLAASFRRTPRLLEGDIVLPSLSETPRNLVNCYADKALGTPP